MSAVFGSKCKFIVELKLSELYSYTGNAEVVDTHFTEIIRIKEAWRAVSCRLLAQASVRFTVFGSKCKFILELTELCFFLWMRKWKIFHECQLDASRIYVQNYKSIYIKIKGIKIHNYDNASNKNCFTLRFTLTS